MSRRIARSLSLVFVICLVLVNSTRAEDAAKPAAVGKLVIVKAVYGDLPDGQKVDVTEKVTSMLENGRLKVEATNDNFSDPAEGVLKKLKVDYTLDGVPHSRTVEENQTLTISNKPPKIKIVKALYGDLPDGAKNDVTARVADEVDGDTLSINATNDNFGDPAEGVGKKLKVDYTIDGVAYSKTVEENATLSISAKPSKIVIRKAYYGDLPDGAKTDVTDKVRSALDGDTLSIKADNDTFGDPAVGVGKKLKVDYTFDGKEHSKTVEENETLTIDDKGE